MEVGVAWMLAPNSLAPSSAGSEDHLCMATVSRALRNFLMDAYAAARLQVGYKAVTGPSKSGFPVQRNMVEVDWVLST